MHGSRRSAVKPQSSTVRKHRNTALFALFTWSAIAVASSHINVQSEEKAMTNQQQPILESRTQAFIDGLNAQGGKPLYELSYAEARKLWHQCRSCLCELYTLSRGAISRAD